MPIQKIKLIEESDPFLIMAHPKAIENGFDYRTLKVGDIVDSHYGIGTVIFKHGETYIEFKDGSGCSIWDAYSLAKPLSKD